MQQITVMASAEIFEWIQTTAETVVLRKVN